MTISTFIRLTATLTASFVLCATAALAQGPGIDDGSHWEPMFKATGTIAPGGVVELMGGQPPVLGQTSHRKSIGSW